MGFADVIHAQTTAKSSAMVPRMIWDHVVFGPKNDQKPGFLDSKHSKTLKNTQKHSKTLKNTPNMPGTALVTPRGRTTAEFQISQKTQKSLCKGPKRLRRLFLAVTK